MKIKWFAFLSFFTVLAVALSTSFPFSKNPSIAQSQAEIPDWTVKSEFVNGITISSNLPEEILEQTLGQYLNIISGSVKEIIEKASVDGQYLIEKSGREVSLLIDNLDIILSKHKNQTLDRLSRENQKIIASLDQLVKNLEEADDRILELQDFAYLDIQNLLPFRKDKFLVRRIKGYSQVFRNEGSYTVRVLGNAFNPDNTVEVWVRGQKLSNLNLELREANTVKFSIPAKLLNSAFLDKEVARVDIEIKSYSKNRRKELYHYSGQLLLLPRYPLEYSFKEIYSDIKWSNPIMLPGEIRLPRSPGNEKWTDPYSLSITIPKGHRMVKNMVGCAAVWAPRTWASVSGPTFSGENDSTATWIVRNQTHDRGRLFRAYVHYQKPIPVEKTKYLYFSEIDSQHQDNLRNGTYILRLSNSFKSFDLTLKYFNGEKYILTPTMMDAPGAKGTLETMNNFNRLRFDVDLTKVF